MRESQSVRKIQLYLLGGFWSVNSMCVCIIFIYIYISYAPAHFRTIFFLIYNFQDASAIYVYTKKEVFFFFFSYSIVFSLRVYLDEALFTIHIIIYARRLEEVFFFSLNGTMMMMMMKRPSQYGAMHMHAAQCPSTCCTITKRSRKRQLIPSRIRAHMRGDTPRQCHAACVAASCMHRRIRMHRNQ